ncbi:MAG TPA: hypothetical protein VMF11_01900 [Candidatus Baltobacteraceae bacterium]|nr:hypothetical protein [Candidatus Baltobacteraceae bacterium]
MSTLSLAPVERLISFIGDSRAAIFDGHALAGEAIGDRLVVTRSRTAPYFRSSRLFAQGRFGGMVSRWLWELGFLVHAEDGDPAFSYDVEAFEGEQSKIVLAPARVNRTLVVSCGGADAWDLQESLYRRQAWFELDPPFEGTPPDAEPYEPATQLDYEDVYRDYQARLAPLFTGLCRLRDCGFSALHLLGIGPPQREVRPGGKPLDLRFRTYVIADRALREFSRTEGIGYIDVWALTWSNGVREQSLYGSGDHHSTKIVPLIVEGLLRTS